MPCFAVRPAGDGTVKYLTCQFEGQRKFRIPPADISICTGSGLESQMLNRLGNESAMKFAGALLEIDSFVDVPVPLEVRLGCRPITLEAIAKLEPGSLVP